MMENRFIVSYAISIVANVLAISACLVTSLLPNHLLKKQQQQQQTKNKELTDGTTTTTASKNIETQDTTTRKKNVNNSVYDDDDEEGEDNKSSENCGCFNRSKDAATKKKHDGEGKNFMKTMETTTTVRPHQHHHLNGGEPNWIEKQVRRIKVYKIATQIYLEYQVAKRESQKIIQQLSTQHNASEKYISNHSDDYPQLVEFWNGIHETIAKDILLKEIYLLEGFWIKIGQYISSRNDIMPTPYITHLSTLQDSLPSKDFQTEILRTLREELTQEQYNSIVNHIDPTPLSTASLAQVHRAKLVAKDGTTENDVVIKVQHRGVATLMKQDMETFKIILNVLAKLEPDFDFNPVFHEYNNEILKELNFINEANNMEEIRHMLSTKDGNNNNDSSSDIEVPKVIIPRIYKDMITERVLVMEYCDGFPVRNVSMMEEHNVNRELLLRRICQAWAIQMHIGGFFNADPHQGNILISTNKKQNDGDSSVPVLLDFGLTKRFTSSAIKIAFAKMIHSIDENDIDTLLQSFDEMGLKRREGSVDLFEDMKVMQLSLRTTVKQSDVVKTRKQKFKQHQKRLQAQRQESNIGLDDDTEDQQKQKKGQQTKLRNPVEAWPSELIFFGRVTNLLRGLCTQLNVQYPYLHTMAEAARITLRNTVPMNERATQLIHRNSTDELSAAAASPPSSPTRSPKKRHDKMYRELERRLIDTIQELHNESGIGKQGFGLQVVICHHNKEVVNLAAGVLGTANPRPMTSRTVVNIFSVSKAILTIGVLRLYQDGAIKSLDDPIAKYWPEFGTGNKESITIRHALTHRAGLANAMPDDATLDTLLDWSGMKEFLEQYTFDGDENEATGVPGSKTMYHYLTYGWLCGGIIEAVLGDGKSYDDYLNELFKTHNVHPANQQELDLHVGGIRSEVHSDGLAVLSFVRSSLPTGAPEMSSDKVADVPSESVQEVGGTLKESSKSNAEMTDVRKDKGSDQKPSQNEAGGDKKQRLRAEQYKKVLAKYRGREHLMNPSIFNMRKVRASKIPSANMHASAASLAAVLDSLSLDFAGSSSVQSYPDGALLNRRIVDEARQSQPLQQAPTTKQDSGGHHGRFEGSGHQLLDDSGARFGLGFQVHEFVCKDKKKWKNLFGSRTTSIQSVGHAGLGGSVVLTLPEIPLTVAITVNQLDRHGKARNSLLRIVYDAFGLQAPESLLH